MTSATQDAVFIGANKQGHVLDYSPHLVAYGAAHAVALWDPLSADKKGVFQTLNGHTKEVTCVKFVPGSESLVSAGDDGKIIVWKKDASGVFQFASEVIQENCTITTLAVVDSSVLISGSSSGDLCIYRFEKGQSELSLVHTFTVKRNFYPANLALQNIGDSYLLVVGGTSVDLFVYSFEALAVTESAENAAFAITQCAVLTGHEDWIKCLAFVTEKEGLEYILASGSQDRYIRLWRLRLDEAIDDSDEDASKLVLLSNKQYKFNLGHSRAAFSFDALIMGHDDWVTGLKWHPSLATNANTNTNPEARKLQLLSSSADTALVIWEMDPDSGIWVSASRLGELSIKGASTATGSSGGFWSCTWFADPATNAQYILAGGKTGAIRAYRNAGTESAAPAESELNWESVLGVTGPVREVTDLVWSKEGTYFMATSLDQTTRLLAPWKLERHGPKTVTWHEFARPQIHGYDMICLDNISATKFVSGGDEKILRVFEMTQSINGLLRRFCGVENSVSEGTALPDTASLPVLGLSNKAANEHMEAGEASQREEDFENNAQSAQNPNADILESLAGPPLEDHLQRHTLFPELEKLYGHGYEITCCATSPDSQLIASACRSNSAKHAVIRLFNAGRDFQLVEKTLQGHNLTIVSLEFSPCGQYLVGVSRDRQFSLWRVSDTENGALELVDLNQKAHSRIIWDCSWAPTGAPVFVTGSRDKHVKVWRITGSTVELASQVKTPDAVTSVACFQTRLVDGCLLVGVGHENGNISTYKVKIGEDFAIEKVLDFEKGIVPGSRVNKLAFSSKLSDAGDLQLAAASVDTSIRVYHLSI